MSTKPRDLRESLPSSHSEQKFKYVEPVGLFLTSGKVYVAKSGPWLWHIQRYATSALRRSIQECKTIQVLPEVVKEMESSVGFNSITEDLVIPFTTIPAWSLGKTDLQLPMRPLELNCA